MTQKRHVLDVLAQGAELNALAASELDDVNQAHLIVHGVMARAMDDESSSTTLAGLKLDLASALMLHASRGATATRP